VKTRQSFEERLRMYSNNYPDVALTLYPEDIVLLLDFRDKRIKELEVLNQGLLKEITNMSLNILGAKL